jgi:cephalosporin hydroxylase
VSEIETFQDAWELERLVELFDGFAPVTVLEIGAWHGGTLKQWIGLGRTIVVVDDEMRKGTEWAEWAEAAHCDLTLLQGSSQDPELVEKARELGPYDFCFIDADHTYEGVKTDWDNYSPMCDVVALHDIRQRAGYGVSDLWDEVRPGRKSIDIWAGEPGYCGIGVVWM